MRKRWLRTNTTRYGRELTHTSRLYRLDFDLRRRGLLAARLLDTVLQAVGQSAAFYCLLPAHVDLLLDIGDIAAQGAAVDIGGVHTWIRRCERGCARAAASKLPLTEIVTKPGIR